jgi:hypothetical protein
LDWDLKCYHRIIPFDCRVRPNDAEEALAAAAVKVALKKVTPQKALEGLFPTDLSQFDGLFKARFQFAMRSLRLVPLSAPLTNFVIGRSPSEIFDRLSPLALELGTESWRTVNEAHFGSVPVLVKRPFHHFLAVLPDSEQVPKVEWGPIIREIDRSAIYCVVRAGDVAANRDWREITQLLAIRRGA